MEKNKLLIIGVLLIFLSIFFIGSVFAQTNTKGKGSVIKSADEFSLSFLTDEDIKDVKPGKSFSIKGIQYGGWITPSFIASFENSQILITSINNLRLYAKSYLWQNSFIYIRGKFDFAGVPYQSGYDLDAASYLVSLDLAFLSMSYLDNVLKIDFGRKYFRLGTGLVFNGRGDGAQIDIATSFINIKLLGAYTGLFPADDNPFNLSTKDLTDGAERVFAGGTLSKDYYNHNIYFLGLAQFDFSDDTSARYNSQYYGLGARGIFSDTVQYYAEIVYEMGKSYLANRVDQESISAIAAQFGINYYFKNSLNPVAILNYNYGSGDEDRNDYKNPTGNGSGTDTGFIGFGTFNAGTALRPLPGNMHALRVGGSLTPFAESGTLFLRQMVLVLKYSIYLKDKTSSAINYGSDATEDSLLIGHGGDFAMRWRIFSDFSVFLNYGIFISGPAYTEFKIINFAMLGANLSF